MTRIILNQLTTRKCKLSFSLLFCLGLMVSNRAEGDCGTVIAAAALIQEDVDQWARTLEAAMTKSAVSGKPIFVKFEAPWCVGCELQDVEFAKPAFKTIGSSAILVRLDLDQQPEWAQQFGIAELPTVVLLDSNAEVVAQKTGLDDVDLWVQWFEDAVKGTKFEMPDVLASGDPPTRTETKDLIETLGSSDAALREITMERLVSFPSKTRRYVVESLAEKGKLAQKLAVLEVLQRWQAPIDGLDPWANDSFTPERLKRLTEWNETPIEELQAVMAELTDADHALAEQDIAHLLKAKNVRAALARLTRYGTLLLPVVYEKIKESTTDEATFRLTALRYWLTASNELRLGWAGGLIELASPHLDNRRNAAKALVERATLFDQALLLELFADSDPLVRELSLSGLQQIGAKETDEILARLLNDPDPNVRAAVLKQFADAEAKQMTDEVAAYLENETDGDLIVHALRFLKTAGNEEAAAAVLKFAGHESWQVRAEVAEALGGFDADDLSVDLLVERGEAIMKLLEDPDGFVVSRAVKSLPERKDKKLLQSLTDIALRQPEIAPSIVESIVASAQRYSYDDSSISATPFLKQFLTHESPSVRSAGITGLGNSSPSEIKDSDLVALLQDDERQVRLAALRSFMLALNELRSFTENVSADGGLDEFETAPESSGGIGAFIGGLFGKRTPPIAIEPLEVEGEADSEKPEESEKLDDTAEPGGAEESEKAQDSKEETSKLPKLVGEAWLKKWLAGEVENNFAQSAEALISLSESDDDQERAMALACRVALGEYKTELPPLIELVSGKGAELGNVLNDVLTWLPFEERTRLFRTLLTTADSEEKFTRLLHAYSRIRNPESAAVIWELEELSDANPNIAFNALIAAYFGDSVSVYSFSQSETNADLNAFVIQQIQPYAETSDPTKQKLVLLILNQLDQPAAKELARKLSDEADEIAVRDLAFRILLRPDKPKNQDSYRSSDRKPDRSHAIEFLETDEPWKYKTALQFLAFGEESLNTSDLQESEFYIDRSSYYYSSSSSSGVKIKIPKPPNGLTVEQVTRDDLEWDAETIGLRAYFQSLFDNETDLTPLIDLWRNGKSNEELAKLVYQAVASTNRDELVPVVDEIYEGFGDYSDRDSAELYWTIRVMDGKNAIRLRKKIRDEVGMSSLNNY